MISKLKLLLTIRKEYKRFGYVNNSTFQQGVDYVKQNNWFSKVVASILGNQDCLFLNF